MFYTNTTFGIFITYLGIMILIGVWFFFRRKRDISHFFLGSRHFGSLISALSYEATDMSSWLFIAIPGMAYSYWTGTNQVVLILISLGVGTYLNWLLVAGRFRIFTGRLNSTTLSEYFEDRFNDYGGAIRFVSAIFVLIFLLFYLSSIFLACGKAFHLIFGFNYHAGLILAAVVIFIYTAFGGFFAVSWTDAIQGVLMFLPMVILPVTAYMILSKNGSIVEQFNTVCKYPEVVSVLTDGHLSFVMILSALAWGFGCFGQPHLIPKFMAIRSVKEVPAARRYAMIWFIVVSLGAIACGLLGFILHPTLFDPQKVFYWLTGNLTMPLSTPFVCGLLFTGVFASAMSTADNQLLTAAAAAALDIGRATFFPKLNDRMTIWLGRAAVFCLTVAAVGIVYIEHPEPASILGQINTSVFKMVAFAWGGFGASFGPVVLVSLYWRKMSSAGAVAGILTGGLTTLIWSVFDQGIFQIYELLPGFIASFVSIFLVSHWIAPDKETLAIYDRLTDPTPVPEDGLIQ